MLHGHDNNDDDEKCRQVKEFSFLLQTDNGSENIEF